MYTFLSRASLSQFSLLASTFCSLFSLSIFHTPTTLPISFSLRSLLLSHVFPYLFSILHLPLRLFFLSISLVISGLYLYLYLTLTLPPLSLHVFIFLLLPCLCSLSLYISLLFSLFLSEVHFSRAFIISPRRLQRHPLLLLLLLVMESFWKFKFSFKTETVVSAKRKDMEKNIKTFLPFSNKIDN